MMTLCNQALEILNSAIEAVKPARLFRQQVRLNHDRLTVANHTIDLSGIDGIFVVGAGKASAHMARALEDLLGERICGGLVTVKYGHGVACRQIIIKEAGHPLIDAQGLKATSEMLSLLENTGEKNLVICLISGGGSALLESLPESISLEDIRQVFNLLLRCGAAIAEINTIRKHLSKVKGGKLAKAIAPAACLSIIISDVIDDPLDAIASGPTAPDPTTFADAWQIIRKYRLEKQLPPSVGDHLERGTRGQIEETLKPEDPLFRQVHNLILANNRTALLAAEEAARKAGFNRMILSSRIRGEAREAARAIAAIVREIIEAGSPLPRPACLLFGGETTVKLTGSGKGGRNQELALAALLALQKVNRPYLFLSCGTDGTDGPTDAAGAFASPAIRDSATKLHLNPLEYLNNNDAYHFFEQAGGLIKTGPTGTNVMDIGMALIPA